MIIISSILLNYFYLFTILIYYARSFFLIQLDFKTQKYEIEDLIV